MKIVLIHGWASDHTVWLHVKDALNELGHLDVCCIDLPGYGARANETYTSQEALSELVEMASAEPCVLVGWSLGGLLALHAFQDALANPAAKVVAIAALPQFVQSEFGQIGMPSTVFDAFVKGYCKNQSACIKRFIALQSTKAEVTVDATISKRRITARDDMTPSRARALVLDAVMSDQTPRFSFESGLNSLTALRELTIKSKQLNRRCHFILGENDSIVSVADGCQIARDSSACVSVISGATHLLPLTHASQIAAGIVGGISQQ